VVTFSDVCYDRLGSLKIEVSLNNGMINVDRSTRHLPRLLSVRGQYFSSPIVSAVFFRRYGSRTGELSGGRQNVSRKNRGNGRSRRGAEASRSETVRTGRRRPASGWTRYGHLIRRRFNRNNLFFPFGPTQKIPLKK
jgi:hypothetical protein